jgi:hypothetical protein
MDEIVGQVPETEEVPELDNAGRVAKLRESLRNGRTNKTSSDTGRRGESHDGAPRNGLSIIGGRDKRVTANNDRAEGSERVDSPNERGAIKEPVGKRSTTGRSGESDSGSTDSSAGGRAAGRLITDDPIPARKIEDDTPEFTFGADVSLSKNAQTYKEDYRRSSRAGQKVYALIADPDQFVSPDQFKNLPSRADLSTKDSPVQPKPPKHQWFKEGKVLSLKEAEELYEPLIAALQSGFEYMDKGIWLYAMSADEDPIWSDMADEEVAVLAQILIKRGQRNAETAAVVRTLVDSDIWIQVGAITVPRAVKTYKLLKGSPRPELRRKQQEARRASGRRGSA